MDADARRATDRQDAATKRSLLAVSRSLESLAEHTAALDEPLTVVALFEEAAYFAYERERYAQLAQSATVIVGFVGEGEVPAGVTRLTIDPGEPLADEWTVLVASPVSSGGLVARDLGTSVAALSLERGRMFVPEMSTDPAWVAAEVDRVLVASGRRLPDAVRAAVEDTLAAARDRTTLLPERVLRDELLANWWRTVTSAARLEHAEHLALTDPLTGAYNRRFLDGYLQRLGPRAPQVAVLAFDLDGFKGLNDTYGHAVGDAGLRAFADLVRATVRSTDVLVRLGGDEWLLVMPAVTGSQAVERARAIVDQTAEVRFAPPAEAGRLRVSVGVGVFPAAALDLEAVDAALYRAKRAGGGRVEVVADADAATS